MNHYVSPPPYRTPPLIFKSKYTTVAECSSDVVCDQFCFPSSPTGTCSNPPSSAKTAFMRKGDLGGIG
ncbi:hypothetical protein T11_12173 [Trichinella zimbabwensis]|uniref:Uncharacterized protein n=1 Tax=Trichinella zimbabwensis TaxID=268475 RepID=A0A0V1GP37_9BILA|nr:hypothetical protein T11_12173 [Trichinella zimbabwensis]